MVSKSVFVICEVTARPLCVAIDIKTSFFFDSNVLVDLAAQSLTLLNPDILDAVLSSLNT